LNVEEIFQSKTRVKLLFTLLKYGEINITHLIKDSKVDYRSGDAQLELLKREGLIEERRFGRIRILKVNYGDPRVASLKRMLDEWNKIELRI